MASLPPYGAVTLASLTHIADDLILDRHQIHAVNEDLRHGVASEFTAPVYAMYVANLVRAHLWETRRFLLRTVDAVLKIAPEQGNELLRLFHDGGEVGQLLIPFRAILDRSPFGYDQRANPAFRREVLEDATTGNVSLDTLQGFAGTVADPERLDWLLGEVIPVLIRLYEEVERRFTEVPLWRRDSEHPAEIASQLFDPADGSVPVFLPIGLAGRIQEAVGTQKSPQGIQEAVKTLLERFLAEAPRA